LTIRFQEKGKSPDAKFVVPAKKIQVEKPPDSRRARKKANKNIVREMVQNRDIDGLVALCFDDKKTLRLLQRQLYEPDEAKRWGIACFIGELCSRVATRKPGMVSDLLHLLFEACSDSAASNWGAVEAIGSIIAARPDIYGSFTRHLLTYIGDPSSRVQVLWALGTIAGKRPDLVRNTSFYQLVGLLDSPLAEVKGYMVRLLGRLKAREVAGQIRKLQDDATVLTIYENGLPVQTDIATLAKEALQLIETEGEKESERAEERHGDKPGAPGS